MAGTQRADGIARFSRRASAGALLLGIGGAVLFLAKPPSAAATAVVVAAALLAGRRVDRRTVLVAVASAGCLLLAFAVAVDGSPADFMRRLTAGAREVQLLDGGHSLSSILRLDGLGLSRLTLLIGFGAFVAFAALTWCSLPFVDRRKQSLLALLGLAAMVSTAAVISLRPGAVDSRVPGGVLLPLAMPLSAIACRLTWELRTAGQASREVRDWEGAALGAGLLLLPLSFALGSNADTWVAARQHSVLWILTSVVLLRPLLARGGWRVLTATVVGAVTLSGFDMVRAAQEPYRQPGPAWEAEARVMAGSGRSLRVSEATAEAVGDLQAMARRSGLGPGTTIIDLTGQAPGLVFALSGTAANSPWVPGSYPGSENLLRATLERLTCRDATGAWLLVQQGGPRSMAEAFFPAVGASADDYTVLGSAAYPPTNLASAVDQPPVQLLRGDRTPAVAERACDMSRERK